MGSASRFLRRFLATTISVVFDFFVLFSQEVEEQAIVRAAVDEMTLPLSTDKAEVEALYRTKPWVMFHDPCTDGVKAQIRERKGQQL